MNMLTNIWSVTARVAVKPISRHRTRPSDLAEWDLGPLDLRLPAVRIDHVQGRRAKITSCGRLAGGQAHNSSRVR
jgi:hypothetical protein